MHRISEKGLAYVFLEFRIRNEGFEIDDLRYFLNSENLNSELGCYLCQNSYVKNE